LTLGPGTVDVSLLAAAPTICLRFLGERAGLRAEACASFAVGLLDASGHGYTREDSATRSWLAPEVGVAVSGPLTGHLGWMARITGVAPLHDDAFAIDGVGTAYEPLRAAVFVAAGATLGSYSSTIPAK